MTTKTTEIESPLVEEIANTEDSFIQKELTKFNIADATIAQWKEQYGSLTISDPNNKEAYEVLNQARTFIKKKRIEIEKKGKELRSNAIKFQKAVISEESRLIELINPLETYLEGEKKRVDDIKLEEKRLRDEKEQIILQERAVKLIQMGMQFNGDSYTMGDDIKISVLSIKTSDDFIWTNLVVGVEKRFKEQEAIRIEQERIKENAAAEVKRMAEETLARQEELNKKQAELEAQQKAIEAEQIKQKAAAEQIIQDQQASERKVKEDLLKWRKSSLFALGFSQQNQRLSFKDLFFTEGEIIACSEETWNSKLEITSKNVNQIKDTIEKQRQQEIENARQEAIKLERKKIEDESNAKALAVEKIRLEAEKKEKEEEKEKIRLASLAPDSSKYKSFMDQFDLLVYPNYSTKEYQDFNQLIKNTVISMKNHIQSKIPK